MIEDDVRDPATSALFDLIGDPDGLRILDLACGQGRVARELARRGASVTDIDISAGLLDKAKSRERAAPLAIRYELIDASSPVAFVAEVFDGVACNFGLSDIDDLDGALASVAGVLPTGGWFVFSILHPCFPGWETADAPSSWRPVTATSTSVGGEPRRLVFEAPLGRIIGRSPRTSTRSIGKGCASSKPPNPRCPTAGQPKRRELIPYPYFWPRGVAGIE